MTPTLTPVLPAPDVASDVRLVTVDMDGTLLDDAHELPRALWPLLAELERRGVLFCPASGRQYANLAARFGDAGARLLYIAENGSYVVRDGVEVSSDTLDRGVVHEIVAEVRALTASGADVGVVVCGKRSAYVERTDDRFRAEADRYYALLAVVDDLLAVDDEVLKVAVFDFGSAARTTAPALARFAEAHQVVVSGEHWVDVMNPGTHKGAAVRRVQEAFGITPAQTMAFGDYLNDLEMLDAAELSFAMANAHPDVVARARYVAPANAENGVVRTVAALLGIELDGVDPV
ncbi:Cof-type HAD-IIB family hydrolase [Actinotalea sp. AC32]|nr:Cof-type HAD-IIB family hydrolase [Actinotalea sp. AC32]